ncbi:MAG: hypothetical protein ABI665_10010 [Vicinamibacterales bacterium]
MPVKVTLAAAIVLVASTAGAQPGELVERTLAIVGGQVITLSDVNAAIGLGLVEGVDAASPAAAGTARLVERVLILREVQRYAPPDPGDAAIDARLAEVRAKTGAAFARVLEQTGFTEVRLRDWIRDDLRSQAYLAQRLAAAGMPSDPELAAAFTSGRAEFDAAGTTFEQAVPILRERLTAARRRELITDWVTDLRRRTDVVVLPQ